MIGFPVPGWIGFTFTSIVDLDAAAEVLSALGAATLTDGRDSESLRAGAGCVGTSLDAVL